jgi:hypothetical protein
MSQGQTMTDLYDDQMRTLNDSNGKNTFENFVEHNFQQ